MSKQKNIIAVGFSSIMAQDVNFYEIARKYLIKGLAKAAAKKFKDKILLERTPQTFNEKIIFNMMVEDFRKRFKDENCYPQMKMEHNPKDVNSIIVSAEFEESDDEFFYKWKNQFEEENVKNG